MPVSFFLTAATSLRVLAGRVTGRLVRDDRGASMVEYALLVALIAVVALAALTALGHGIAGVFQSSCNAVSNAGGSTSTTCP
jgi:pilus assembly protein Flp/PilA